MVDSSHISDVALSDDAGTGCGEVTRLLEVVREGDEAAVEQIVELVYDELRQAAAQLMSAEPDGHTLQPTALVHEAFLKLRDSYDFQSSSDRAHVMRTAVCAMRRLLVDSARRRNALKRGGKMHRHWLDEFVGACEAQHIDIVDLGEALDDLADVHERACHVTTLRFFGGFQVQEVARQLDISVSTVESDFRFARAWLRERMRESVHV